MANELRHADVTAGKIDENNYEDVGQHILNDQAIGDIIYASSTSQLKGLAVGATDTIFSVQGGVPVWRTPADVLTDLSGQAGAAFDWNTQNLTGIGSLTMTGDLTSNGLTVTNDGTKTTLSTIAGDYWRFGDAGTTNHSLNSEDDVMITGNLEVKGKVWIDHGAGLTMAGNLVLTNGSLFMQADGDTSRIFQGVSSDICHRYSVDDSNAKTYTIGLPHVDEDGSNVACMVLIDYDALGTDLGAGGIDLTGITKPTLVLGNEASSSYGKLGSDELYLLEKAAADGDIAGLGQLWVKNDTPNTPWFTDDAGNDVFIGQGDYAGIYVEGNSGATTINLQHSWELVAVFDTDMPENISNGANGSDNITIGATGVYRANFHLSALGGGANKTFAITAFKLASSGSAITSTTEDNPVSVAATGHGFSTGNKVKITGVTTATILNNRIFTITKTNDDAFTLQEDNGGNIDGTGFGTGSGGTATLATELKEVHADRKWSANDVGQASGGGFVSLAKDDILEMFIKNITDATNFTVETCQFMVQRVG